MAFLQRRKAVHLEQRHDLRAGKIHVRDGDHARIAAREMPDERLHIRSAGAHLLFQRPFRCHAFLCVDAAGILQLCPDLRQRHFAMPPSEPMLRLDAQTPQIRHIQLIRKQVEQRRRFVHAAHQQRVKHIETDHIEPGQPSGQAARRGQRMLRGLAAGTDCLLRMQTAAQRMHGRLLPAHPQPVIGIPCPLLSDHPVKQTLFHDIPHFLFS